MDSILPYVLSAPFLLSGFFILSVRLGELTLGEKSNLEIDTSSPESIFNSMENYSKFKEQEGKHAVQATGYLLLTITITLAVLTVVLGVAWLFLLAALGGMGGNPDNSGFESSFNFIITILKICFWTYIGSNILIARPWALFIEEPPLDSSKTVTKKSTTEPEKIEPKRLLYCPKCAAAIRVPMAYKGRAKCPKCEEIFEA
ncbi:hypothetical protein N9Y75_03100 [Candidatus Poseidoniales archaeon]|nr:hypothetical protein [Candidatus Poseidoniales archaeon]MDB2367456.1 hypothetical protein [Candidatus Poseidoniales archaeon]MDB2671817.1 hypothetical protein [Candidatus Poseidoniales archaeon]MDC3317030.1 hypothetical protein [Candidatus Poseidoniaceae archaeon]